MQTALCMVTIRIKPPCITRNRSNLFECFLVVKRSQLFNFHKWSIVMKILQHKAEPSEGFHTDDVAAFDQRVEDGIVNNSAVTFAEQVIFTAHYRRTLISFDRIVVYMIASVKCVSLESWPQLVGVVEGFAHGVSGGAPGMHLSQLANNFPFR